MLKGWFGMWKVYVNVIFFKKVIEKNFVVFGIILLLKDWYEYKRNRNEFINVICGVMDEKMLILVRYLYV